MSESRLLSGELNLSAITSSGKHVGGTVMNKENVLFSLVGVLLGFIIGFVFANAVNKGAVAQTTAAAQQVEGLPPGHPAVDPSRLQPQADRAAVTAALKLADDQPDNFDAQTAAAKFASRAERYEDAVKYLTRANRIKPDDYDAQVALGNALFDGEKFADAEQWYARALQKKPDDVNVRTDMGLTFLLREPAQFDRAIAEFKQSLQREPNHVQTLQNLTVAYTRKGDVASAQVMLAKLELASPQSPALAQLRADIEKARAGTQSPAETSATQKAAK
jgi:Flp pilus assembly protein TadD